MIFTRRTIPTALLAALKALRTLFSRNPVVATPTVQDIRERRCLKCTHLIGNQCGICSCVVSIKVLLASESCPDSPPRWKKQTRFSTGL